MKRRQWISRAGAAGFGLGVPGLWSGAYAQTRSSAASPKLVVVLLRGAVDGLNVVVPHGEAEYYRARTSIAVAPPGQDNGALDLDGRFGLHPALAPVLPLWQQGTLAFVHAAGSADPTRSHFDAQDYMESGTPGRKSTGDGWMNRLLEGLPPGGGTTRAISVGPVMPRILSGRMVATNIASGAAAARPGPLDRPAVGDAFNRLYQGNDALARAYRDARESHQEVMTSLEQEMRAADNGAPLPNGFPTDAANVARLMRSGRVQLAFLALGGWDTHVNQGAATGQLASRLTPLAQGLATLARELGPQWDETVVVVMSEFGRTVRQNGNNGTDHGHGNVMWLLGGRVAGGRVHGQWPGLAQAQLYEGRDLAVTTDFRAVLTQVAERHMRLTDAQLERVFPSWKGAGEPLSLLRA